MWTRELERHVAERMCGILAGLGLEMVSRKALRSCRLQRRESWETLSYAGRHMLQAV